MSLKVRLLLGAAAPFVFILPAAAQVQITTATTAPVSTATANSGAPANVEITSAGSIAAPVAAGSTVVTINSSNSLTNNGQVSINNSDNATGVRILPNFTGGYSGTGQISVIEDYVRTDTDSDGDLDGALAQGTGRAGILVDPGGTMNGNILIGAIGADGAAGARAGGVTVKGNNSFGVSIRSALNGNYVQRGGLLVTGSNSIGLDVREDVTGNIVIGGTLTAQGEGAIGARILGDVAGEFSIDGTVLGTGFTSTSALDSNYVDPVTFKTGDKTSAELRDADDLLVGGSGLEIRGDLARGFLVNGDAVGGADPTPDVKDVVQNFNVNRTTGAVQSFGSASAVLIQSLDGAAGDTLQLGLVRESVADTEDDDKDGDRTEIIGVFNYDYGFINRGVISGNGLNVGFASNALQIAGSADGTHQTIIDGGIFNKGTIATDAREANSTAFIFGSGASTPQLVNTGAFAAALNTETDHDATAILVQAGASLPSVTNSGLMQAKVHGYGGDAVAFRDLSGTVTSFRNTSRIATGYEDNNPNDTITSGTGRAIALDLSHSSLGVTLTQADTIDNARIFGDVLLGASNDRFDLLSGEVTGDVDFGTAGSDVLNINSAKLFGDAVFHGSNVSVSLDGSTMTGALTLGAAAGALSFTNNSVYNGAISSSGPVSMVVNNSTVNNSGAGTLNLSSMSLANNAKVGFVIDNARVNANTPIFNVTGTADIAANTVFTPIFQEFTNRAFTLRVLNASTLNLGGPVAAMLNADSPYLFDVGLVQPTGVNALDLTFRVKTATELGLNTRQADAYAAVLNLMEQESTVGAAVTSIPGAEEFLRGWSDLLPASDASVMRVLASNATAAFGATAHRLDLISDKPNAPGGAWAEEFGVYHDSDASADGLAVSGGGFGVSAGIDLISSGSALIGAFASLESLELEEDGRTSAPLNVAQTTIGGYGGWRAGNLAVNGAAGVGFVDLTSDRKVQIGTLSDRLRGDWKGLTYNAGARATYTVPLGFLDLKPYIAGDYMSFKQDAYQENATTLEDLELITSDGESTLATGSYGLSLVGNFGSDDAYSIKPQLSVGYRNVLTWDPASPSLRFAGGSAGTTFNLNPGIEPEDAIVAGFGLNIDSEFLNMKLGYDTEISDTATTHYGSITLRMAFW